MRKIRLILFAALLASCTGGGQQPDSSTPQAMILEVKAGGVKINSIKTVGNIPVDDNFAIDVEFSREVTIDPVSLAFVQYSGGEMACTQGENKCFLHFVPKVKPQSLTKYRFSILGGEGFGVDIIEAFKAEFITAYDTSDKFERIPDDELLTLVQKQTFKYFWDYAHPVSGLARERLGSDETVTTGGSGFGIMCIPVGVSRGFITREQGAERMRTIAHFLAYTADRFHGAYPHWLNGTTGKVIPFSEKDNGGDLVETAFLVEGLLTARAFFDRADEADIRALIDTIWDSVEWDWYLNGKDVLYWHWSPSDGWAMNMPIRGWNEALMCYVLGASSTTHPIPASAYHNGWARNGSMKPSVNGPMFFAHYSFLGLNPHGLVDQYANYWDQNVSHAQYNYDYCVRNQQGHAGYSASCWGLTASDYPRGYTASAPSNDTGTIAPTAALASMPYLPSEAMAALHAFYYIYGDRLWGQYGFKDAFNLDEAWFASSYIAIDQGPIVVMIENYRTGLLWDLFMKDANVAAGLKKLGF